MRVDVADLADAPAARRRQEKSGTSSPARRRSSRTRDIMQLGEAGAVRSKASANTSSGRQQADDEERFVREVEEVAGMHEDALAPQQIQDQRLLAARRRHAHDGRPAAFDAAAARRRDTPRDVAGSGRLRADALWIGLADRRRRGAAARGAATCTGVLTDRTCRQSARAADSAASRSRGPADDRSSPASPAAARATSTPAQRERSTGARRDLGRAAPAPRARSRRTPRPR